MKPRRRLPILAVLLALAIAACARVEPVVRDRIDLGNRLTVLGSAIWNRLPPGTLRADAVWTQDGLPLDHVVFIAGRPDGEPLFNRPKSRRSLEFRAGMTATEVADLWSTEMALSEYQTVTVDAPRPVDFGGHPGFHFGFRYADADGLLFDGMAAGAVVDSRLFLIVFAGTRAHHFPAYQPAAGHLIRSARIDPG